MGAADYDPFAEEEPPAALEEDSQLEFERAAIEAARGWIDAMKALDAALEREAQLKLKLRKLAQ